MKCSQMARRFYYMVCILVGIAIGAVLGAIRPTQGDPDRTGVIANPRGPTGENNEVQEDGAQAIAGTARHQALSHFSRPAAPVRQSDVEDDSLDQSSVRAALMETAAHKGTRSGKKTATKPVAKLKLAASNTTVKETKHGPVATFRFSPTTTDPLGPLMIVAFLPPGSDAKILDLSPTKGATYSRIDKRISENGWFAAFQGTPQDMTNLSFNLSVSQPAIATIKGNRGIEPFNIDLRPGRMAPNLGGEETQSSSGMSSRLHFSDADSP